MSICNDFVRASLVVLSGASLCRAQKMVKTSPMTIMLRVRRHRVEHNAKPLTFVRLAVQFTIDQIDVMNRLQQSYPDDFSQQLDSKDIFRAFRDDKLISPLGVEGLHQIGNKASNLRLFHAQGVRYATLTHNCHNIYADAAVLDSPTRAAEPHWGGISPAGKGIVQEMNRIGMIVDLAHVRCVLYLPLARTLY